LKKKRNLCNQSGYHPQENVEKFGDCPSKDLAKFGYKLIREVPNIQSSLYKFGFKLEIKK
jgi:hypothetical protein